MVRIAVATVGAMAPGETRIVPYPEGTPPRRSLIVVHDGDRIRAYWNVCAHLPIPLDAGAGAITTDADGHLVCSTHGATYAPATGLCVWGPCEGASLEPVAVEEEGGRIFVVIS